MRGPLLLGKKGWKERRDLARADEASCAAPRFVSWVFSIQSQELQMLWDPWQPTSKILLLEERNFPHHLPLCICFSSILPQRLTEYLSFRGEEKEMARGGLGPKYKGGVQGEGAWAERGVSALRFLVPRGMPESPESQNPLQNART